MAEAGKDEAGRKTSGSGASPDGSAKTSTPKMRTKKLTVDPNLTPAVTEPKPNFALYALSFFRRHYLTSRLVRTLGRSLRRMSKSAKRCVVDACFLVIGLGS